MKVKRSVVIDAPIERVWQTVRRFDGVAVWNPGVNKAILESGSPTQTGSVRKLEIVDGSVFRETLLAHSDLEHYYTYDIIESPLKCSHYIARHHFIEITEGNKTLGIWEGEFQCDPSDEKELNAIVGDGIYRDAQLALNQFLLEQQS
ncbi:MAG: SRPBCC family protein [Acidiferrobacterales bacterium]|nr:SRPBCC family protein [Acidiferrobacterales bacterium]